MRDNNPARNVIHLLTRTAVGWRGLSYWAVAMVCGCLQAMLAPAIADAKPGAKPNVVVIITDDQGWGDIGYNNPENVYTPNLDRLAAEGVRLANHYVMPQCTPTRVAVFTGRYPGRFGRTPLQASNKRCFPVGTPTLATMLKAAGYETYQCGKWHMGEEKGTGVFFGMDSRPLGTTCQYD